MLLHYYSRRSGLYPIVKGLIREVSVSIMRQNVSGVTRFDFRARRIYDTEVVMKVQERKQEHVDSLITEHVVFVINQVESSLGHPARSIASKSAQNFSIENINVSPFPPHHYAGGLSVDSVVREVAEQ